MLIIRYREAGEEEPDEGLRVLRRLEGEQGRRRDAVN